MLRVVFKDAFIITPTQQSQRAHIFTREFVMIRRQRRCSAWEI